MKYKLLFNSLLLLFIFTNTFAKNKESRKERKQKAYLECLQLIESGEFKFEAEKAYPQTGSFIDLTSNYGFIQISNEKSSGDLPFFGRAYKTDYNGNGGINFKGEILKRKLIRNDKKMKIILSYDIKDIETFSVTMIVFSKESASIIIQTDSKAHISYSGRIIELKKDDLDD